MAQAKVDLAWSSLRPRRSIPDALVRSIHPADLSAFLRTLAKRPLDDYSNAAALRTLVLSIRAYRCEMLDATRPRKDFALLLPPSVPPSSVPPSSLPPPPAMGGAPPHSSNKRRRDHTDQQDPTYYPRTAGSRSRSQSHPSSPARSNSSAPLSFSSPLSSPSSSTLRPVLYTTPPTSAQHRKQRRLPPHHHSPPRPFQHPQRPQPPAASTTAGAAVAAASANNRRSTLPTASVPSAASSDRAARPRAQSRPAQDHDPRSRGRAIPLGSSYQARVPPMPSLPEEERVRPQVFNPPIPQAAMLPSSLSDNKHRQFVDQLKRAFRLRDGVSPTPFIIEAAHEFLLCSQNPNDFRSAVQQTLASIGRGPYFPGIKNPLTYEEHCLLARTLMEGSKNFDYISRGLLPKRSTSELVWIYYALFKQTGVQQTKFSLRLTNEPKANDYGVEQFKKIPATAQVIVSAISSLARTAGDGFPLDLRVSRFALQYRNKMVTIGRRRRENAIASRGGRLR